MNQDQPEKPKLFTEDEYKHIIMIACKHKATEEQIGSLIKECEKMKCDAMLLQMIMEEMVDVKFRGNTPRYIHPEHAFCA